MEEIDYYASICILAIGIEFYTGAGGMISLFSVQGDFFIFSAGSDLILHPYLLQDQKFSDQWISVRK